MTRQQLNGIKPYFPVSHRVPRVDDRRVISRIIDVIGHGLEWKDAPTAYGRITEWRRIAMRYDRCAHTFFSVNDLAATSSST